MIELITPREWIRSESFRREIFSFRYKTFVDDLGWKIPNHDYLEFDEFDALLPVYMVSRDLVGRINAVWRLLPTNSPYLLRNIFPEFLGDRAPPQDPTIWEISRFAFNTYKDGVLRVGDFTQVAGNLFCALGEFGLEIGMSEVLALFDHRITPILRYLNCKTSWTGPIREIGGIKARAASFLITKENLKSIREAVPPLNHTFMTINRLKDVA